MLLPKRHRPSARCVIDRVWPINRMFSKPGSPWSKKPTLGEERYKLPVYPVLINFLPPAKTITIQPHYSSNFLGCHAHQDYRIINLWEIDAHTAFQADLQALTPFVPIMPGGDTPEMRQEAARQLRQTDGMSDFEPLLGFFANFGLDSALVQQILRWDMVVLEESPSPPVAASAWPDHARSRSANSIALLRSTQRP